MSSTTKKLAALVEPRLQCVGSNKAFEMNVISPVMGLICNFKSFIQWYGTEQASRMQEETWKIIASAGETRLRISNAQGLSQLVSQDLTRMRADITSRIVAAINASALAHATNHENVSALTTFFQDIQPDPDRTQASLLHLRRLHTEYLSILWHEYIIAAIDGMLAHRAKSRRQALDTTRIFECRESLDINIRAAKKGRLESVSSGELSSVVRCAVNLLETMDRYAIVGDAVGFAEGAASWYREHVPMVALCHTQAIERSNWTPWRWNEQKSKREQQAVRNAENYFWGEAVGRVDESPMKSRIKS